MNLNTNYRFASGRLSGFSIGGTYQYRNRIRQAYAVIGGERQLYFRPDTQALGVRLGYEVKFQRVRWSTQVNVTNILNARDEYIIRDANGGIAQVLRSDIPLSAVWTNTFKF